MLTWDLVDFLNYHMTVEGMTSNRALFVAMKDRIGGEALPERTLNSVLSRSTDPSRPTLQKIAQYLHDDKMPIDESILVGLTSGNKTIRKKSVGQLKGAIIRRGMQMVA